jgi:hypothetical protein
MTEITDCKEQDMDKSRLTDEQERRCDELMDGDWSLWPRGLKRFIEQQQRKSGLDSISGDTLNGYVQKWVQKGEPSSWT